MALRSERIAGVVLALAAICAGGGANGQAAAPSSRASSGDFGVIQLATTNPDKLIADWAQPTPGVQISTTTRTPRHKPIVTFIVFHGCRTDTAGKCNVTVDFDTIAPGGKPYDHTAGAEVWVGKAPPPGANLQLSIAGYGIAFEDKDALGVYQVRATVIDHVAGVTVHTEQDIEAIAP